MARLSPDHTRRLLVFIAVVLAVLAPIYALNRKVKDDESALSLGGNAQLRTALERLQSDPAGLAMTMGPSLFDERHMRQVNARIIPHVDVLVIGQSDADHISGTFFRPGVGFYNGFVSNSHLAYQYEVFEEVSAARGMPDLVLFDVRSGLLLLGGDEPSWDTPADKLWWDGPPKSRGEVKTHWYREIDSLLSLQQTELTARSLWARYTLRHSSAAPDADSGASYLVVPANKPSGSHRWLGDGSRIYPGEVNGVLVPRFGAGIGEAIGVRKVNPKRLAVVAELLDKFRERGANVIVYVPPVNPRAFEQDPRQVGYIHELATALRETADKRGFDFCDFGADAVALGCKESDFYDELHVGRGCGRRVIGAMATECAKRFGPKLRDKLAESVLRDGHSP